jgi:hypothetical protein
LRIWVVIDKFGGIHTFNLDYQVSIFTQRNLGCKVYERYV